MSSKNENSSMSPLDMQLGLCHRGARTWTDLCHCTCRGGVGEPRGHALCARRESLGILPCQLQTRVGGAVFLTMHSSRLPQGTGRHALPGPHCPPPTQPGGILRPTSYLIRVLSARWASGDGLSVLRGARRDGLHWRRYRATAGDHPANRAEWAAQRS